MWLMVPSVYVLQIFCYRTINKQKLQPCSNLCSSPLCLLWPLLPLNHYPKRMLSPKLSLWRSLNSSLLPTLPLLWLPHSHTPPTTLLQLPTLLITHLFTPLDILHIHPTLLLLWFKLLNKYLIY
ncbi:unnamed protein product [Acanthoscelides obtectus]|uniref:Uncharacterized protein n=1 Tax=Acanthoscelides obtectus TaxID=200917 RepID=A0A9P0JNR9_ACAOB|nr:unnamed protein product [Acanthoscelides obtectus]CAK1661780.1 hypothetical protein AOBTE_LOCUS22796 [Acanthoscelides obtectus]